MTLVAECAQAAARSAVVAAGGLLPALALTRLLLHESRRIRRPAWFFLLLPFLTPALVVGYTWANLPLAWVHDAVGREILYLGLLLLKMVPVGAVVLVLAPRPLTAEAVHCGRLLSAVRGPRLLSRMGFSLRGPAVPAILAAAFMFLLAFGEFEMASLLGLRTWTVALFDAHTGGLALEDSFRLVRAPFLVEGLTLVGVYCLVLGKLMRCGEQPRPGFRAGCVGTLAWIYLAVAAGVLTAIPGYRVFHGLAEGFAVVVGNFSLWKEVAASGIMAVAAAVLAHAAAAWLVERRRTSLVVLGLVSLPGLLGPLVLGLAVVSLFQVPGPAAAYDSPLPLLLALTLLLLPPALVLRLAVRAARPAEGLHLALLLGQAPAHRSRSRGLVRTLKTRGLVVVLFLLFCWGYFDLTASSLLAPSSMPPVTVRLYNFMHYGRSSVLSALTAVVMGLPVAVLLLGAVTWRLLERRQVHG